MTITKPLAALALIAAGFAGLYAAGENPKPPPEERPAPVRAGQPNPDPRMPHFMVCAKACDDCERICNLCATHCAKLAAEGKKEHLDTARACIDCAAICGAAATVTAKDGVFSDLICTACADACKRCGDLCEKHSSDPIMKQCAEECRRCEKACREMIKNAKVAPKGEEKEK
jgi:hypothetical protein